MSRAAPGSSWLEIREPSLAPRTVMLDGDLTLGRHPADDGHQTLVADATVSRFHISIFRRAAVWCIADLGASNGTSVNGTRLGANLRILRADDEIRLGERTVVLFRSVESGALDRNVTCKTQPVPQLTPAERKCLRALCQPLLNGDAFTEPTRVCDIAAHLVVSESAVKQLLARLYAKFSVPETGTGRSRRGALANEAISRGVMLRADLDAG